MDFNKELDHELSLKRDMGRAFLASLMCTLQWLSTKRTMPQHNYSERSAAPHGIR